MNAQRNLAETQSKQATTFERLSTGLRINSAKDDAAGLYLAEGQTKDIKGLNMATRNANDGISMAQTAEGALDQVGQNLQRINELAIQSANGSYNDAAREGLQKEVDQLTQEINRIVETTEFNGTKLLSRDATSTTLQIGFKSNEGSRIATGLEGGLAAQGTGSFSFAGSNETFATEDMAQTVGQVQLAQKLFHEDAGAGLDTALDGVNLYPGATTITNMADDAANGGTDTSRALSEAIRGLGNGESATVDGMTVTRQASGSTDDIGTQLKIEFDGNETTVDSVWNATDGAIDNAVNITATNLEDLFGNGDQTAGDISANAPLAMEYLGTAGALVDPPFVAGTVDDLKAYEDGALETLKAGESVTVDGFTFKRAEQAAGDDGRLQITSEYSDGMVNIDDVFDADGDQLGTAGGTQAIAATDYDALLGDVAQEVGSMSSMLNGDLEGTKVVDISTQEAAQSAIDFTRSAIDQISEVRATFGAVMNRFDAVISGNQQYSENLNAARSRIQDADFAQETANLAKQQTLQQAGIAALGQANASSQAVLGLL
jgi:flagellin